VEVFDENGLSRVASDARASLNLRSAESGWRPRRRNLPRCQEKLAGRGFLVMPEFFVVGQLESGTEGFMEVLDSYPGMFCGGESKARP
jgi:hypothetical protein